MGWFAGVVVVVGFACLYCGLRTDFRYEVVKCRRAPWWTQPLAAVGFILLFPAIVMILRHWLGVPQ